MYNELIKRLRELPHLLFVQLHGHEDTVYKAADAIEELQQIAWHYEEKAKDYLKDVCYYLERMPMWIPVTLVLPEEAGKYLVCGRWRGKQIEIWICEFMTLGSVKGWANNAANPSVSHWMPLPEPPKEE